MQALVKNGQNNGLPPLSGWCPTGSATECNCIYVNLFNLKTHIGRTLSILCIFKEQTPLEFLHIFGKKIRQSDLHQDLWVRRSPLLRPPSHRSSAWVGRVRTPWNSPQPLLYINKKDIKDWRILVCKFWRGHNTHNTGNFSCFAWDLSFPHVQYLTYHKRRGFSWFSSFFPYFLKFVRFEIMIAQLFL